MKLVVFSICKDEAETIGKVLDRIPKKIKGIKTIEKWVISDGSTDDTVNVAKKHGANVVTGIQQKRLAFRFRQAMDVALANQADIAVNIDGDLQFPPEDIPNLIRPILEDDYDFVAADRLTEPTTGEHRKPENMPTGKYWANRMGAWVLGKLSQYRFRDVTCGFRAYNRDALFALSINGKYTYTQESFQVLAKKRMNITSMPVEVKYYPGRQSRVVGSFWQFLFGSALNILRSFRDLAPLRFFVYAGSVPLLLGLAGGVFTAGRWLIVGQISPFISVGVISIYLFTLGIFIWGLGIVADMLDRSLNNQEKILEETKRIRHEKKR
jgi:glycosyltransferase involved in cell wall biosynthesis